MALADEMYDAHLFYHEPAAGEVRGREALKQFVSSWRAAFPDAQLKIEDHVAEGDKVATRWTFVGTHRGEFRGIAPTGRQSRMRAMYCYRFAHGKILQIRAMVDSLSLLQQIGAVPPQGQAKAS